VTSIEARLRTAREELVQHLYEGIINFWTDRGIDTTHGGYLTCFDAEGRLDRTDTDKYIVTQTRMIWGFSLFHELKPEDERYLTYARQGVDFLIEHFWDVVQGGWVWKVARDGRVLDDGKVVYGQSFAIYALAQYTQSTGDPRGLDYAGQTFNLLQHYCADVARGGYYENLEPDWMLSTGGFHAGNRKSLDIHMHLMECFTTLAEASGEAIHRRRLQEVIDVILNHMVDWEHGCGGNQYDLAFNPLPAIAIRRTFNAEREGEGVEDPVDSISYGHNLELAWLLLRAAEVLGQSLDTYEDIVRRLVDHAIKYGLDKDYGGVYRDGPHDGPAWVKDKEFWQNAEALVGFLDACRLTGDPVYVDAFELTWSFVREHMINDALGEWRTLLSQDGAPRVSALGTPWKACYHSGRAVYESIQRIDRILVGGANG
jgi:mannobiose 2-epimerase